MRLFDYTMHRYCPLQPIKPATKDQYGYYAADWDTWTNCPVDAITDDRINAWIDGLFKRGLAPWTIKTRRNGTLVLIRHAVADGFCSAELKRIRKVTVGRTIPRAITMDELQTIIRAIRKTPGYISKCRAVSKAAFWEAFVRVAYDSGLRICDLRALRFEDISDDGVITIVMQKTGFIHRASLKASTLKAIERIRTNRKLVFPWHGDGAELNRAFKRICKRAGVKATLKMLRRTSATMVANAKGFAAASQHLGHRDPNLAVAHYVDQRQLTARPEGPPELETRTPPELETAELPAKEQPDTAQIAAIVAAVLNQLNTHKAQL